MLKIRTIVIDDEPLARARILRLLALYPEVDVIGEARNGKEAIQMINAHHPDLIFLDIQMPDLNGFEVLELRGDATRPFIVFVTAYDQYAVQAFSVHAVDYLLKPYDDQRFAKAFDHARTQILLTRQSAESSSQGSADPIDSAEASILIKDNNGLLKPLRYDRIVGIRADGNYLHAYTQDARYLLRMTMAEMTQRLPSRMFLRIHRSYVVNRLHVVEVSYRGNNTYRFKLANQMNWVSSRGFKKAIVDYLQAKKE